MVIARRAPAARQGSVALLLPLLLLAGCGVNGSPQLPFFILPTPAPGSTPPAGGGTPAEPAMPVDTQLDPKVIVRLVPTLVTMSGDPNQPKDPADMLIAGDPINLALLGTKDRIDAAFAAAAWVVPDPISVRSALKMGFDFLVGDSYPTAPVSNLYLFGRAQDLAFELPTSKIKKRDHCRAWSAPAASSSRPLWLLAGSQDVAVEWDHRRHEPTHKISPDLDTERDLITRTLVSTGMVDRDYRIPGIGGGRPCSGHNGGGDLYVTDGFISVVEFKD